jgi:SAM-dependent methyltransferase
VKVKPSEAVYGGVDNLEIMEEARNYNAFLDDLVRRHARQGDRVLDFGAGTGRFAGALAPAGFAVTCIEPDKTLRARIVARGLVAYGDLSAVAPSSIDYAYTLNVLEHIEDDGAALRALRERLRPGGRLLVYVPAFQVLYSAMDARVGHLRRYRLRDLARRAGDAGLGVEAAAYCDSLGFLATLAFKAVGNRDGRIDKRGLVLFDRFAFPASLILDRVAGRLVGKNLWLLARRPGG